MRPRVVTGNVATLDGRIAACGSVPSWQDDRWAPILKSGIELIDFAKLHGASVILEGSNSFVSRDAGPALFPEAPALPGLYEDYLPKELLQRYQRWMAVVDSRGRVEWAQTQGGGVHVLVLVSQNTPPGYLAFLRERNIPYLVCGEDRVDLELGLLRLKETFAVELVVSTAGGVLNGALLRAGLVDEVNVQVLPFVLGSESAPALFEGYNPSLTLPPHTMRLLDAKSRPDGSVLLRYAPDPLPFSESCNSSGPS